MAIPIEYEAALIIACPDRHRRGSRTALRRRSDPLMRRM
jgi:hypothetical protein